MVQLSQFNLSEQVAVLAVSGVFAMCTSIVTCSSPLVCLFVQFGFSGSDGEMESYEHTQH